LIDSGTNTKEQPVEYDIGETGAAKIIEKEAGKIYKTKKDKSLKGTFIQIGSFSSKNGANITLEKGNKLSDGFIKEVRRGNKTIHKILLGPVKNKNE
jgi:cell division septation protein DedD